MHGFKTQSFFYKYPCNFMRQQGRQCLRFRRPNLSTFFQFQSHLSIKCKFGQLQRHHLQHGEAETRMQKGESAFLVSRTTNSSSRQNETSQDFQKNQNSFSIAKSKFVDCSICFYVASMVSNIEQRIMDLAWSTSLIESLGELGFVNWHQRLSGGNCFSMNTSRHRSWVHSYLSKFSSLANMLFYARMLQMHKMLTAKNKALADISGEKRIK